MAKAAKRWTLIAALGAAFLAIAGCVTRTRPENAALAMPWPAAPSAALMAYAPGAKDDPTVGGDVLKGTSPAEQAAARAAASRALEDALATP